MPTMTPVESQVRERELEQALTRVRDALPAPEAGTYLHVLWLATLTDLCAVPAYVQAYLDEKFSANNAAVDLT